jgi:acyl-CoA synthetase (AMP-forming)/AMP-acid ligase II
MTKRTDMTELTEPTLVSLARERASADGDRTAYTYLDDGFADARSFSWRDVDERSRAMAVALSRHVRPGDRALLVLPPGPDFLFAFLGCLYAGVVAVPAPVPVRPRDIARLTGLHADAAPSAVVTIRPILEAGLGDAAGVPCLTPEDADLGAAGDWKDPGAGAASLAFLQYTSGSTGNPKGVMVSHANILANEAMIARSFGMSSASTVVGWLPHFHDMGLIGSILQPLFVGAHAVLASPMAFMRDPLGWLRTISRYRARTSGGPNFAYELCVRRHERLGRKLELDLSSWDLAFVGAEPVRAATMRRFADTFAAYGFDERALFPCYGLAEATLFVTGGEKGAGLRTRERGSRRGTTSAFVGCGRAAEGLDVEIVDPETMQVCPDGVEGEVLVAGPSVSAGYWNRPDETRETFGQRIAGKDGSYLRTGDLAVRLAEGVYITGRSRDLIIVAGQNYYPQDLEASAEGVQGGVRPGNTAAFGFDTPEGERVGLVCEVSHLSCSPDALCAEIRAAVGEAQSVRLDVIVLVEPRTLPKTTSGKVERRATRRAFLDGTLSAVATSSLMAA